MWRLINNSIFFGMLLFLSCTREAPAPPAVRNLVFEQEVPGSVMAGEAVLFRFRTSPGVAPRLLVRNGDGVVILFPEGGKEALSFRLPDYVSQRAGEASWALVDQGHTLARGSLLVSADQVAQAESYLGPKRLRAGAEGATMLTIIPTDRFDNLLPDGQGLQAHVVAASKQHSVQLTTSHQVGVYRMNAPQVKGRVVVGIQAGEADLTQLEAQVTSGPLEDFDLSYQVTHPYADGHEQFQLSTSELRDVFGNTVEDGLQVTFRLQHLGTAEFREAYGLTVNGRASTWMLHPDQPGRYKVSAFTSEASSYRTMVMEFYPALQPYTLHFDAVKGTLRAGPFKGFMGQRLPEGTKAYISLLGKDGSRYVFQTELESNQLFYDLRQELIPQGSYQLLVSIKGREESLHIVL